MFDQTNEEVNSILKSSEQDKPTRFEIPTNIAEKILFTLDHHRQIIRDSQGNMQHFPPVSIASTIRFADHHDSTLSLAIEDLSSGIKENINKPNATINLNTRQVEEVRRILLGTAESARSKRAIRDVKEHELYKYFQILEKGFIEAGGKLNS